MPTKYDLAIIGSGGGAFAAAIRATTLGKSVVMIERGTLGGTCVNTGCVPSKAL
ncbi:FAD-dependent oxidoreductase, partial [Streptomyces sp. NPDC059618]